MKDTQNNISSLLLNSHGIDVSKYDETFLKKSIEKRIIETHYSTKEEYLNFVENNKYEATLLVNSLHNNYSEFFRNPLTFAVLERIILPSLIQKMKNNKSKEIRIWSAACAAGQEAYSLSMLMAEFKNDEGKNINHRIFASDQCESIVNTAQKGTYYADALNNVSLKRVKQWFTKHETSDKHYDTYSIKPELKEYMDFSVFDLFNEQLGCPQTSIFGDFDLVICANLLFYYKPAFQKIIIEKAVNCLCDGGYVVVGETERDILMKHNYQEVFPQSGIFQRK